MPDKPAARLALLALFGGATGIGFAPVLVRLSEVGPSATAFHRMLFALPFVWAWMRGEQRRAPAQRRPAGRRDFLLLAATGLLFTADLSIWHWSLQFTTVANSTLLTNFCPVFVALGAWLLWAETITGVIVVGMALALVGAAVLVNVSFQVNAGHLLGDGLALVAALFYAGYLLAVKHLRRSFSAATLLAWSGLVSCPAFLLVAVLSGEKLLPDSSGGWTVLIALALVSHVGGQTLIAYGLGHLSAAFSSVSLLWQPVVAAMIAWVVLQEPLSAVQVAGGVVVLAGIAIASGSLNGLWRPADRT